MQVDGVARDAARRIVFAENVVARLAVVLFHFGGMLFAFFAEIMGAATVAGFVGLVRAVEAGRAFGGFLAGEVAQAVIFGFGIGGGVVKVCGRVVSIVYVFEVCV